jgi:tetratricopeptide (TPR) repeat protein
MRSALTIFFIGLIALAAYGQDDIFQGEAKTISKAEFDRVFGMQDDYSAIDSRLKNMDFAGVRAKAGEFIAKYPNERSQVSYVYYMRALAYHGEKRHDLALKDLGTAINLNSSAVWAYLFRGQFYIDQKKYAPAITDLSKAIEIADRVSKNKSITSPLYKAVNPFARLFSPNYGALSYGLRAEANLARGQRDAALSDARKALDISKYYGRGAHSVLFKLLGPEGYITELSGMITAERAKYPEPGAFYSSAEDLLAHRISAYIEAKRYADALKDLDFVIEQKKRLRASRTISADDLSDSYLSRADIHLNLNRLEASLADLNQVLNLGQTKNSIAALYNRSDIYVRQQKFPEAIADLTKVIQQHSKNKISSELDAQVFGNRAYAYASNDQRDLALADINKVVQSGYGQISAFSFRASLYCSMGRKADAKDDETKVVSLGGKVERPCR